MQIFSIKDVRFKYKVICIRKITSNIDRKTIKEIYLSHSAKGGTGD